MKVAICTPVHSMMSPHYVSSLVDMVGATVNSRSDIGFVYFWASSSDVCQGRTALVRRALDYGTDYILWLDADHTFPPDTLVMLLSHNLPLVGANYVRRAPPWQPTASHSVKGKYEPVRTTAESAAAGKLEEVGILGLGVCLTATPIFSRMSQPWFAFPGGGVGEDGHFCKKARAIGIKPFVDHALSWQVGHVAEFIATNALYQP